MGGIFSGPKLPPVEPAPLPPDEDPKKLAEQDEKAKRAAQAAAMGGKASTLLTTPLGAAPKGINAAKYLLG